MSRDGFKPQSPSLSMRLLVFVTALGHLLVFIYKEPKCVSWYACLYWDQYYLISSSVSQTVEFSAPQAAFQMTPKLSGALCLPERKDATQRDLESLEEWDYVNLMMFTRASARCCTWVRAMPSISTC